MEGSDSLGTSNYAKVFRAREEKARGLEERDQKIRTIISMQKDFTYDAYSGLIDSFKKFGYVFLLFIDFISNGSDCKKGVALKHDADKLPNKKKE